ncbi:MAG: tetratricopeptide repeat protein [Deltaproteobacteria bacterium]
MSGKKGKKAKKDISDTGPEHPPSGTLGEYGRIKTIFTHRAFAALLLFIISFAVFIPSIHNGLVWDDNSYVEKAANNHYSSWTKFNKFIPKEKKGKRGKYFRPVYGASLDIDNKIWNGSPRGFHLTNVVLHSVTTVLLYFLILLLFRELGRGRGDKEAFLSCMLFAVYPLHVESVSFIAARGDILAALFFLLCLIFYIYSYRNILFIVLAGFFLYLSFLSKEVAFSFPILVVGFDLISRKLFKRVNIFKYLILGSILAFYIYMRSRGFVSFADLLGKGDFQIIHGPAGLWESVNIFLNTYLFYVKKFLYPYDLNHFIGTITGGGAIHLILSLLLIGAASLAFVVSFRKKENITAFSILWVFATLGPAVMIALYPLAITRYAERFTYVPSAGYCLLLGYLLIQAGIRSRLKWVGWAAGGVLFASFVFVTVRGQEVWKDNFIFWEHAARKSPGQMAPLLNYGDQLRNAGRTDEAIRQFQKALSPEFSGDNRGKSLAAHGLGVSYIDKGDYNKAEKSFKAALNYNPEYEGDFNYYMGYIFLAKNDLSNSRRYFEQSTQLNPGNPNAHYLLGGIYFYQAGRENSADKYRLAEKSLQKALRIRPGFSKARIYLAKVYLALGEKDKAREQALEALNSKDANDVKEARAILSGN